MKIKQEAIRACQLAAFDLGNKIEWIVENIRVALDRKTRQWTYEELIWNDETEDWTSRFISKTEAKRICEVALPTRFYT